MNLLPLVGSEGFENLTTRQSVRVLGIDLGTTNSTVAEIVFDPQRPDDASCQCLPLEQKTAGSRNHWNPIVPSCVALHNGKEWIGEGARQLMSDAGKFELIHQTNLFHSCKNDMGLQKTYAGAPSGYRNARDISSRILSFLYQGAHHQNKQLSSSTCVTVPASFQVAQRNDTLNAAKNAAIPLTGGELLDEPVAAFICYLASHPEVALTSPGEERNLLVFDFGGGTCDVGLFRLSSNLFQKMDIVPLSVSRYHRLGGGDIDQAIFYEIILPQILEQNEIDDNGLDYDLKKYHLEPAFLCAAERLKVLLCEKLEKYLSDDDTSNFDNLEVVLRGEFSCLLPDGTRYELIDPVLWLDDFDKVLEPFIDPDCLFLAETEYRQTLSIFTPINDALARLDMGPSDVDLCLLVGGSSLIPQIRLTLDNFFTDAEVLTFGTADETQMAVAKGAAINALSLMLNQRPVIQPICQETIGIMTTEGAVELIPQKTPLPWPSQTGYATGPLLTIPQDSDDEPLKLKVEIIGRDAGEQRVLMSEHWEIPAPVRAGDKLRVESRFDLNQTLKLRLIPLERDDVPIYEKQEDHPFTHIANPQATKLRIEKTEELIRTGAVPPTLWRNAMIDIAKDCAELKQYEKAISQLSRVMRHENKPDSSLLNLMALYAGYMGDQAREEKFYRTAIKHDPQWSTPWFNLSLLLEKQEKLKEAIEAINTAIELEPNQAPYHVLKSKLVKENGQDFAVEKILHRAKACAKPIDEQSNWELHWSIIAAEMTDDKKAADKMRKFRQRQSVKHETPRSNNEGYLPGVLRVGTER